MNEYIAFGKVEAIALRPRPVLIDPVDGQACLTLLDAIYDAVHDDDKPLVAGHYQALRLALKGDSPPRTNRNYQR